MIEITTQRLSEELTLDGVTMVDVGIDYPSVTCESQSVAKRINAFYAHQAKALLRAVKKTALAAASAEYQAALETSAVFRPLTVTAVFDVTYNDGHILSLYRDVAVREGTSVRALTRQGETWCVSTGWLAPLSSFFPHGERYRRVLTRNAAESAASLLRAGTHSFFADCAKLIRRKFSPENYYITEDGIVTFYARGVIAPESEGIVAFEYERPYLTVPPA